MPIVLGVILFLGYGIVLIRIELHDNQKEMIALDLFGFRPLIGNQKTPKPLRSSRLCGEQFFRIIKHIVMAEEL